MGPLPTSNTSSLPTFPQVFQTPLCHSNNNWRDVHRCCAPPTPPPGGEGRTLSKTRRLERNIPLLGQHFPSLPTPNSMQKLTGAPFRTPRWQQSPWAAKLHRSHPELYPIFTGGPFPIAPNPVLGANLLRHPPYRSEPWAWCNLPGTPIPIAPTLIYVQFLLGCHSLWLPTLGLVQSSWAANPYR